MKQRRGMYFKDKKKDFKDKNKPTYCLAIEYEYYI